MKKSISIIAIFTILFLSVFTLTVNAAELDTLDITLDKQTVNPDGTVTLSIAYGQELGAATIEVDYDTNLFEYQDGTGITSDSDVSGTVTAIFTDATGGDEPSTGMTLTFKAKSSITTSNPTQFLVTLTGLANPDGSETFDDILTPIIKDVLVEPDYKDYVISVNYTGTIMPNVEHDIDVNIASTIGRYYDHLRLTASVTKPDGSTVELIGVDNDELEHDVIDSGWGAAEGFGLGGPDVNETYHFKGTFSLEGAYTLTLNLIDRDDSDAVISTVTKNITVGTTAVEEPIETPNETPTEEILPEELPKTGMNNYLILTMVLLLATVAYAVTTKK